MPSERISTGVIAGAIVGTLVFGGMSILLLTSKKETKKGEKIARADSQTPSEKLTKAHADEFASKAAVRHAEAKHPRLEEVEEARESPPRKADFLDGFPKLPTPKPKDSELPTPKTDKSDLSPREKDESDLPTWKPDAKALDELAREVAIGQYVIRPPKGYQKVTPPAGLFPPTPGASKQEVFVWSREPRPDGTRDLFTVAIAAMPPEVQIQSLKEMFEDIKFVLQNKRGALEVQHENGRIGEIPFGRIRFSGLDQLSRESKGFCYAGKDDRNAIVITGIELDSVPEPRLKFAEAAALTFKRR
jgi:hypothetical protein